MTKDFLQMDSVEEQDVEVTLSETFKDSGFEFNYQTFIDIKYEGTKHLNNKIRISAHSPS